MTKRGMWLLVFAGICLECMNLSEGAEYELGFMNALESGSARTLVAYGTSLTAGGEWVSQVATALNERFPGLLTMINSGQGAMWSGWGVENLEQRVIEKDPDGVFIEFGINDAYLPYDTSVEQSRQNLESMIGRILAARPGCDVMLLTMNPPTGVHLEIRPDYRRYYEVYREAGSRGGLSLIDVNPVWERLLEENPERFMQLVPDGIHPNGEGSREVITPTVLEGLYKPPRNAVREWALYP